jgi:hypothetical protein
LTNFSLAFCVIICMTLSIVKKKVSDISKAARVVRKMYVGDPSI